MTYVYKVFFGNSDVKHRPIPPDAYWKMILTLDIAPGNASKRPKYTTLGDDLKVAYKILHEIRAHRAFMVFAGMNNEGVDQYFIHAVQGRRNSGDAFPVIIEVAKDESHGSTILGMTIWNTSTGTTIVEDKGWTINYHAKGPVDFQEYS